MGTDKLDGAVKVRFVRYSNTGWFAVLVHGGSRTLLARLDYCRGVVHIDPMLPSLPLQLVSALTKGGKLILQRSYQAPVVVDNSKEATVLMK